MNAREVMVVGELAVQIKVGLDALPMAIKEIRKLSKYFEEVDFNMPLHDVKCQTITIKVSIRPVNKAEDLLYVLEFFKSFKDARLLLSGWGELRYAEEKES